MLRNAPMQTPVSRGTLPRPSTPEFDRLLRQYRLAGLPMIGVGSWGPCVPQTQPPSPDVPSSEQLDREMKQIASSQWGWISIYQPVDGFAGVITAHRREPSRQRQEQDEESHPERFFAPCMWASHACHIQLQSDHEIAEMLELRPGELDAHWREEDWERYRSVNAAVERGDAIWAAFGAWPWSAFPDGHPPLSWWKDPRASDALIAGVAAQAEELTNRLRHACYLMDGITSGGLTR